MARYAINYKGIEELKKLAYTLTSSVEQMNTSCGNLYERIDALEADLGVYRKEIYEQIKKVIEINRCAGESIQRIAGVDIPDKIERITELLVMHGKETQTAYSSGRSFYYEELGQMMEKDGAAEDDEESGPQKVYKR